ncbi:low temperature requirement protein A [Microbacterium aurum]
MSMSHRLGRMSGRDPREPHRAATPPELLFDLTFVKRYSLLVIIALGEVVLGTILTISAGVQENQWTVDAGVLAVGGTALAFGLWWVYFTVPFGTLLAVARPRPFVFGYLHYFVFGAIVAIGAGLHVAAQVLATRPSST